MPHFFDPSRKRIAGQPGYPATSPIAALPSLYIEPLPDGNCRVGVMLMVSRKGARWFEIDVELGQLPYLLGSYAADPEEALAHWFKYEGLLARPTANSFGIGVELGELDI